MGVMQHDIVVATTWNPKQIEWLEAWSEKFRHSSKFLISKPQGNGIYTVCLISDGSKEGWPESDQGDNLRANFIEWMDDKAYDDGSNDWTYAEVSMGDLGTYLVTSNKNENIYEGDE